MPKIRGVMDSIANGALIVGTDIRIGRNETGMFRRKEHMEDRNQARCKSTIQNRREMKNPQRLHRAATADENNPHTLGP